MPKKSAEKMKFSNIKPHRSQLLSENLQTDDQLRSERFEISKLTPNPKKSQIVESLALSPNYALKWKNTKMSQSTKNSEIFAFPKDHYKKTKIFSQTLPAEISDMANFIYEQSARDRTRNDLLMQKERLQGKVLKQDFVMTEKVKTQKAGQQKKIKLQSETVSHNQKALPQNFESRYNRLVQSSVNKDYSIAHTEKLLFHNPNMVKTHQSLAPSPRNHNNRMFQSLLRRTTNTQSIPNLKNTPSGSFVQINHNSSYYIQENINLFLSLIPNDFSKPERLMVELIKKILVYTSKIDTLREKLCLQNPAFSPFTLFHSILDSKQNYLSFAQFINFLDALEIDLEKNRVVKILNYLSGYFLEKKHPILAEKSEGNESFRVQFSWFMNIFQSQYNRLYEDFPPMTENLVMGFRDAYVIRKIIMLLDLKLREIQKIVRQLRKYNGKKLFDFLRQFESSYFFIFFIYYYFIHK